MPNSNVSLVSELPIPKHWQQSLQKQNIETKKLPVKQLIGHADYVEVHCKGLVLKTGAVLVCSGNPALSIFEPAGLGQLIEVIASLNSPIFSNIFAVGDCAHFRPTNGLAKSDDFAQKAAPVLFENLYRSVQGRYVWQKFVPRRSIFRLQNYGKNQAMLEVGGLRLRNSWFLKAKNFLDQKFIKKYE
jgi:NADH dehydrogenase FAD-containing subunit